MNHLNKEMKEFTNTVAGENGTYLYYDRKGTMNIFLNGINVDQGSKALYFTDFNVEADGDTLNILLHHDYTEDYSDPNLNYQKLYQIKLDKTYDKIMLFDNGEESSFHTIYN